MPRSRNAASKAGRRGVLDLPHSLALHEESPADRIPPRLLARPLRQGLDDRKVRKEFPWQLVALLEVRRSVVRKPDLGVRVFRDQDLERQVDGTAGRSHHERSPSVRIAEDQELGGMHSHPDFFCFTAVIDERKKSDFLGLKLRDELLDGLIDRVTTASRRDAVLFFRRHVRSPLAPEGSYILLHRRE